MKQLLVSVCFALILTSCDSGKVRSDRSNCEQLKEGMPYAEVLRIMGQPEFERTTDFPGPGRSLTYSTPAFASGPITVQLAGSDNDLRIDYLQCKGQN
jgi:hypothetical protein